MPSFPFSTDCVRQAAYILPLRAATESPRRPAVKHTLDLGGDFREDLVEHNPSHEQRQTQVQGLTAHIEDDGLAALEVLDENGELVGMVMDAETLADFKELAEYHGVPVADSHGIPHYTVEQTSDAFADPFIIRDNAVPKGRDGQYYDVGGIYQTFEAEEEAQEYADTLNSADHIIHLFAQKDAEREA